MKKIITVIAFMLCVTVFAQGPKVEYTKVDGNLVKATYYFADNSSVVEREGFFNSDKKLDGMWVSYNLAGEKIAIAYYKNGVKVGVWTYIKKDKISLVTYDNNKITNIEEKPIAVN